MKISKISLLLVLLLVSLPACIPLIRVEHPVLDVTPEEIEIERPSNDPLEEESSQKLISDQDAPAGAPVLGEEINPVLVMVEEFYQWIASQPAEEILVERSYEDHLFLSDIFKSDVGYLLDSFEDQSGYDPFTCSQAILPGIDFGPLFVSGGEALVMGQVIEGGETRHYFVVHLGTGEGSWKIDAIHCPFEPGTAAIGFYTAYLGHLSSGQDMELGVEILQNPFNDGFWDQLFLVSDSFRAEVIQNIEESNPELGGGDPILQAQSLPVRFWVQPGQEGADIEASLNFGPYSTRHVVLHMVESPLYTWVVDDIEMEAIPSFDPDAHPEIDTTDWQLFEIEEYGVNLMIPQGWRTRPADLTGMPPEDPLKQSFFLFPSWASDDLPALWVNILEGNESQMLDYYVIESHQQVKINDQTVWVDRDQCQTRFVYPYPNREDTWVVIGDNCPGMAGREAYQEVLDEMLAPLLRSVSFDQN